MFYLNGGEIIEKDEYTLHFFKTVGSFNVDVLNKGNVEVLVVAGGGGGGGGRGGGGGGAGGVVHIKNYQLNKNSINITVGNGGNGGTYGLSGSNGSNSNFDEIIAIGGGGGGQSPSIGSNGGSGGGTRTNTSTIASGLSTQNLERYGGSGFNGGTTGSGTLSGGGGGGAGGIGGDHTSGNGGNGIIVDITGENIYYGGGGGGGNGSTSTATCLGGLGGGGNGGYETNGFDASNNTGGGGGGGGYIGSSGGSEIGGNGGSGIVIVRYKKIIPFANIKLSSILNSKNRIKFSDLYGYNQNIPLKDETLQLSKFRGLPFSEGLNTNINTPIIKGGNVKINNNSKYHILRENGNIEILRGGNIEILVVAGGGGGGGRAGGGGGAGGVIYRKNYFVEKGIYNYTIGNGGLGGGHTTTDSNNSTNGENSIIFDLEAIGGGRGLNLWNGAGLSGGSGGGGSYGGGGGTGTLFQGFNGGGSINTNGNASNQYNNGGGGGAGGNGGDGNISQIGNGGVGIYIPTFENLIYEGHNGFFGGGGGGGAHDPTTISYRGLGGNGGGGNGGSRANLINLGGYFGSNGDNGIDYTGGGGGGGVTDNNNGGRGGNGGKGVIIIKYSLNENLDGLLDISNPSFAYSLYKLYSNYNGPNIRLRREIDNQEADIYFDKNGKVYRIENEINNNINLEKWLGNSKGFVTKFYDQSNNNNHLTQTNNNLQPELIKIKSGLFEDKYGLFFGNATNRELFISSSNNFRTQSNQPFTIFINQDLNNSQNVHNLFVIGSPANNQNIAFHPYWGSSNIGILYFYNNDVGFGAINQKNYLTFTYNGGSLASDRKIYDMGVMKSHTGTNGTIGALNLPANPTIRLGNYSARGNWSVNGSICDFIGFNSVLSESDIRRINKALMDSNVKQKKILIDKIDDNLKPNCAFALYKLNNIYNGPIIRVKRSDNLEADIYFNQRGDITLIENSRLINFRRWLNGLSCNIIIWYDQSGFNYHMSMKNNVLFDYFQSKLTIIFNGIDNYGSLDGTINNSIIGTSSNLQIEGNKYKSITIKAYFDSNNGGLFNIGENEEFSFGYSNEIYSLISNNDKKIDFSNNINNLNINNKFNDFTINHTGGLTSIIINENSITNKNQILDLSGTNHFELGRYKNNNEYFYFKGKIDSLFIYHKNNDVDVSFNIQPKLHLDLSKYRYKENVKCSGGDIVERNGFRYHIFKNTGSNTLTVEKEGVMDILMMGGGGSGGRIGGWWGAGGGGGAGGCIYHPRYNQTTTGNISITVGAGGLGVGGSTRNGNKGGDTIFNGSTVLTALGGGAGGNVGDVIMNGGCGGGRNGGTAGAGGSTLQSSQSGDSGIFGYGNIGGNTVVNTERDPGSGGGIGQAGFNGGYVSATEYFQGANGGDGLYFAGFENLIFEGHDGWFGGGGASATERNLAIRIGGKGGGGNGGRYSDRATSAINNTGGGGGGCGRDTADTTATSGNGGSGVVIVRYPINSDENIPSIKTTTDIDLSCIAIGKNVKLPSIKRDDYYPYLSIGNGTASSTIGNYVDLGNLTLNVATNGGFTFIGVFRMKNPVGSWERMFDIGNGQGNDNILLHRNNTAQSYNIGYFNGSTFTGFATGISFTQNQWDIVGFNITSNSSYISSLNGKFTSSITRTLKNISTTSNFIGKTSWSADHYANMDVREIMFYDYALSVNDIENIRLQLINKYNINSNSYSKVFLNPLLLINNNISCKLDNYSNIQVAYGLSKLRKDYNGPMVRVYNPRLKMEEDLYFDVNGNIVKIGNTNTTNLISHLNYYQIVRNEFLELELDPFKTSNVTLAGGSSIINGYYNITKTGGYLQTSYNPNLNNNTHYTWECWYWCNDASISNDNNTAIISNYGASGTTPAAMLHIVNNGTIGINERNTSNLSLQIGSTITVNDGKWYHIVKTADISQNLYINGELVASVARPNGTITSGQNIVIGGNHLGRYINARIGNVRLYRNYSLSPEEVFNNYQAEKAKYYTDNNVIETPNYLVTKWYSQNNSNDVYASLTQAPKLVYYKDKLSIQFEQNKFLIFTTNINPKVVATYINYPTYKFYRHILGSTVDIRYGIFANNIYGDGFLAGRENGDFLALDTNYAFINNKYWVNSGGNTTGNNSESIGSPSLNTWNYIVAVRQNNNMTFSGISRTAGGLESRNLDGYMSELITFSEIPNNNQLKNLGINYLKLSTRGLLDNLNLNSYLSPSFSLKRLNGFYTGPIMMVRRSSDNNIIDVYTDFKGNIIETIPSYNFDEWKGNDTIFVTRWYDQSDLKYDFIQTDVSKQPILIKDGDNYAINVGSGKAMNILLTNTNFSPINTLKTNPQHMNTFVRFKLGQSEFPPSLFARGDGNSSGAHDYRIWLNNGVLQYQVGSSSNSQDGIFGNVNFNQINTCRLIVNNSNSKTFVKAYMNGSEGTFRNLQQRNTSTTKLTTIGCSDDTNFRHTFTQTIAYIYDLVIFNNVVDSFMDNIDNILNM
jgi:hypothetical protein